MEVKFLSQHGAVNISYNSHTVILRTFNPNIDNEAAESIAQDFADHNPDLIPGKSNKRKTISCARISASLFKIEFE